MLVSMTDTLEVTDAKEVAGGMMAFDAKVTRTGVFKYRASELGVGAEFGDNAVVGVYRPESSVFDAASMATLAHKTVTDDHPANMVDAKNWSDLSKGWIGGEVRRDGDILRVPLMLADAGTIAKYKAGKVELSAGYLADIERKDGVAPSGEAFQFEMAPPRYNHVAMVDAGRAGQTCRLGDAWTVDAHPQNKPTGDKTMKTILVDGLSVEVTDQSELAIRKLQSQLTDAVAATDAATAKAGEHLATISAKDGEIAALTAKIADAEITPAKLDAAVAARTVVIDGAKKVLGDAFVFTGLTDAAIRKAAVEKALGDAAVGLDDAGIAGAFKVVQATAVTDGVRQAVLDGGGIVQTKDMTDGAARAAAAHKRMVDGLTGATEAAA